jgi:predicted O-methyltransferase YrrM
MLSEAQRQAIARLWARKVEQDAQGLARALRHRNLEPDSAEFLHALAVGARARRMLEIGGSSGVSTIALAAAARATSGRLVSIEIEPERQAEARETLRELELLEYTELVLADAREVLGRYSDLDLVFIDCEKDDYVPFFDLLSLAPGAVVVADNIHSHQLTAYVRHVRSRPGASSITLPVGQGLEVTRLPEAKETR